MKPVFSFYKPSDFARVYHFLEHNEMGDYLLYDRVRFQFCMGLHIDFVENGILGGFERTCGLWEDESGIVSLVITEGSSLWGETFFVFRSKKDKQDELLERMCNFAERFTSKIADDRNSNFFKICIIEEDNILCEFFNKRGYKKTNDKERVMIKEYPYIQEEVKLPDGFVIKDARTVPPFYSALAHNHAFRYTQNNDGCEKGFAKIRTMPDYKPELDLILFD